VPAARLTGDPNPTIQCMEPVDWSRISGNWTHWRGRVRERWGRLTDDHLDVIGGRREQLTGRIQELYGVGKEEAERQLRNWERSLSVEIASDGGSA
jgi:uncharacterized protein YjbJ (UPF0337 family)